MTPGPYLTVIVPVYQGRDVLPACLESFAATHLPRDEWELIVVDDGSTDGTARLARDAADRVIRVEEGPTGPAVARNRGAAHASGEVLVFIDADTLVHPDTLGRFARLFRERPEVACAFGAYDDRPRHPGFLSQYRNLLHRYVHLRDAGPAETFWAGCGAIRRDAFEELDGFDPDRFSRPQIEDIELGYRLSDRGGTILLDPEIQVTHLKRWTLRKMIRTDLLDRGIPWMTLMLERGGVSSSESLNLRTVEKVKTGLVGLACLCALLALVFLEPLWLAGSLLALGAVTVLVSPLLRWFAAVRDRGFALRAVPFVFLYYFLNGASVVLGWIVHLGGSLAAGAGNRPAGASPDGAGAQRGVAGGRRGRGDV